MTWPDAELLLVCGGALAWLLAQERRITRIEDRIRQLGGMLLTLPKRKGD
jgi:hypothetical protein